MTWAWLNRPKRLGQLAEAANAAFLLLGLQDVVDLLDAQEAHAQCQHPDGVASVGPLAGFGKFLFVQRES